MTLSPIKIKTIVSWFFRSEIDGCHGNPKEHCRRFVRQMAVSTKAGLSTDDDDHRTTGFESHEDIVSFLRTKPGYNSVRAQESVDSKGFFLIKRSVKNADPEGTKNKY